MLAGIIEFLHGTGEHDPQIDSWLFFAPQQKGRGTPWRCGDAVFDIRLRSRIETGGRYKAYSEPDHRRAAECFAGLKPSSIRPGGTDLAKKRQAVFLFYAVRSKEETGTPTMGFALLFPQNLIARQIQYTVEDPSKSDAVVVAASVRSQ